MPLPFSSALRGTDQKSEKVLLVVLDQDSISPVLFHLGFEVLTFGMIVSSNS